MSLSRFVHVPDSAGIASDPTIRRLGSLMVAPFGVLEEIAARDNDRARARVEWIDRPAECFGRALRLVAIAVLFRAYDVQSGIGAARQFELLEIVMGGARGAGKTYTTTSAFLELAGLSRGRRIDDTRERRTRTLLNHRARRAARRQRKGSR